ncbi:hypothetical protein BDV06DRAFT_215627 [Aspergillus oleicola]
MSAILKEKVFTITGGVSGMGAATAKLLAQRSAGALCIADRQASRFCSLREELSKISPETKVMTTEVDVSSSYAVALWLNSVVASFGRLDGCANVAGVAQQVGIRQKPNILEETDETWKKTLSVNLDGVMYCTREQVRTMLQLPKAPRTIVNVASLASYRTTPDVFAYTASKKACAAFSTSVAKDVHDFDIRVNTVSPGATLTPMMSEFYPDEARDKSLEGIGMNLLSPNDIARAILYLLTEDSANITGANLPVGLGVP